MLVNNDIHHSIENFMDVFEVKIDYTYNYSINAHLYRIKISENNFIN